MRVRRLFRAAACAAVAMMLSVNFNGAAQAQALNGAWRCFANGNIPIGILTMSGARYRFQPVSNTAWRLNPNDRGNGSGAFVSATDLTPTTGPLKTVYGITSGSRTNHPTSGIVLYFGNANGGLLGCWQNVG